MTTFSCDKQSTLAANAESLSPSNSFSSMPPEILLNMAARLPWRKLLVLLTVCRSWNTALTPLLYGSIKLKATMRIGRFTMLLDTIVTTATDKQLGQFIQHLDLSYFTKPVSIHLRPQVRSLMDIESDEPLNDWQLLPYLKNWMNRVRIGLNLPNRSVSYLQPSFFGERLVRLSLSVATQQELDALLEFRALEELSISAEYTRPPIKASYSYWERLHSNLSRLWSLTVNSVLPPEDFAIDIIPCDTVTRLQLQWVSFRIWIPYFSKKYTSLRQLVLDNNIWEDERCAAPDLLAVSCRQLKSFSCNNQRLCFSFLRSLHSIGAPVAALSLSCDYDPWICKDIRRFHQTVTSIVLYGESGIDLRLLIEDLKACKSLVNLTISPCLKAVELDHVLDELDNLQYLCIKAKGIEVGTNRGRITHRKLKSIAFRMSDVSDEIWVYLSQYCPCLVSIVYDARTYYTRSTAIFYPHPGLKYLEVRFHKNCLYKLVRMSEEERITERNTPYQELIEKHDHIGSIEWYRQVDNKVRQLKNSEVDQLLHGSHANDNDNDRGEPGRLLIIPILSHYVDEVRMGGSRGLKHATC